MSAAAPSNATTYVMTWSGKSVTITGPFATPEAAIRFGEDWDEANVSPCWQTLNGPEPLSVTMVQAPVEHIAGIGGELVG